MNKKEAEIIKAIYKTKSQIILEIGAIGNFNGYYMTIKDKAIMFIQKNQADKLLIVNIEDNVKKTAICGIAHLQHIYCVNILTGSYIQLFYCHSIKKS